MSSIWRFTRLLLVLVLCVVGLTILLRSVDFAGPNALPTNTRLALSADGKQLLVAWNNNAGVHARLIELGAAGMERIDVVQLPADTLSIQFSLESNGILLTTWDGEKASVKAIDLATKTVKTIYTSAFPVRFISDLGADRLVFLEGVTTTGLSQWKLFDHGVATIMSNAGFHRATELNVTGDVLYLLDNVPYPRLFVARGAIPPGVAELIEKHSYTLRCADLPTLTCMRSTLTVTLDHSYSEVDIIVGDKRWLVPGHWREFNQPTMSRNGQTIAFLDIEPQTERRIVYFAHAKTNNK